MCEGDCRDPYNYIHLPSCSLYPFLPLPPSLRLSCLPLPSLASFPTFYLLGSCAVLTTSLNPSPTFPLSVCSLFFLASFPSPLPYLLCPLSSRFIPLPSSRLTLFPFFPRPSSPPTTPSASRRSCLPLPSSASLNEIPHPTTSAFPPCSLADPYSP